MLVKEWLIFDVCTAVRVQAPQPTSQPPGLRLREHVERVARQYIFNMDLHMY